MINWLKQNSRALDQAVPPERWRPLIDSKPALARLNPDAQSRLLSLATCILSKKNFIGGAQYEPTLDDCLPVALLAALPILELGLAWYRGFETFILYPGEFLAEFEEIDEDGIVHAGRDRRAGEAWPQGPVVLSLEDIAESGLGQGYNVVVHELAHQIDQLNGEANGFPPLRKEMNASEWTGAFESGFERLNAQLDAGHEPWLDPYGAEHPAEFFAVCCEYFFDAPGYLAANNPKIYGQLARLFRQDLAEA